MDESRTGVLVALEPKLRPCVSGAHDGFGPLHWHIGALSYEVCLIHDSMVTELIVA